MIDYENEHKAYAVSRGQEYVYVSNNRQHEQGLDDYVDGVDNIPLVVVGKRESGKSSILSNWLRNRKEESPSDFYFVHFSGCSPQNFHLQRMLFRLENALRAFFNLQVCVPKTEEKLRWGLNRFLEAAAKKKMSVKIIIIIDGANLIRSEDNPPGKLHWLPTKVPSCVRFILSTVEFEDAISNHDVHIRRNHRTYTELVKRRQCPVLRVEALKLNTRIQIIKAFTQKLMYTCPQSVGLSNEQSLKIARSKHSSQPLYLRLILTALHLGREISRSTVDDQLNRYTNSNSLKSLLAQILHECAAYVEPDRKGVKSILYFVLSIVHASRHGLTDNEMWGLVKFKYNIDLTVDEKKRINRILENFCMKVNGCHLFSHNFFQNALFDFYISNSSTYMQLHNIMAEYFDKNMILSDRKLSCLVWHLEVSGSWKRLKNNLVDVENFHRWWTHRNKDEFIELWSSLTQSSHTANHSKSTLVTGVFCDEWMKCNQNPRPFYDPVEEYTKSIESYRSKFGMTDEYLTSTLIKVSDFLLEFAILGHEKRADVPSFHHPNVKNNEMERLGVPYLNYEDGAASVLMFPKHGKYNGHIGTISSEKDDMTTHSAYMFRRWMWIYFPIIALRNCKEVEEEENTEIDKNIDIISNQLDHKRPTTTTASITLNHENEAMNEEMKKEEDKNENDLSDSSKQKHKRINVSMGSKMNTKRNDEVMMNVLNKIKAQYDSLVQKRKELTKHKEKLNTEYTSLQCVTNEMDDRNLLLESVTKKIDKINKQKKREDNLHNNYNLILKSCNENPAFNRALIKYFEMKLEEDSNLIEECTRLITEVTQNTQHQLDGQKRITAMMTETKDLYKLLLENRSQDRSKFLNTTENDELNREESANFLRGLVGGRTNQIQSPASRRTCETIEDAEVISIEVDEERTMKYIEIEEKLKSKTSFRSLPSFALRLTGSQVEAFDQIMKMKNIVETRIESLKKDVKMKKEQLRLVIEKAGNCNSYESRELNEKEIKVETSVTNMQKWKEKTDVIENLMREIRHGIESIGVNIGMSFFSSEESALDIMVQVSDLLNIILKGGEVSGNKARDSIQTLKKINEDSDEATKSVSSKEFDDAMAAFNAHKMKIASRIQGGPPNECGGVEHREERAELYGRRRMIKASARDILNLS